MASNSNAPISIPSSASNSNSGTKMAYALAGLLPPLFFEAQIRGGRIGGQFGFSMPSTQNHLDIAIFTRSSGAAFAVGISSFVAYKLLHRLIQTNCLFTTLEQFSPEKEEPSTGEKTVELTEGFYAVRLGGENDLLRRLEDCLSESGSPTNAKNKVAVVQVRQASALKQLFRRNQRIQRAGIAALDQCSSGEEEPLEELAPNRRDILLRYGTRRRERGEEEDGQSTLSGFSNLTSASRIPPNRRHSPSSPIPSILPEQFPECDSPPSQKSPPKMRECRLPSSSSSSTSSIGTRRSASLHLNCDNELCWENEFSTNSECPTDAEMEFEGEEEGLFLFREREGSLGGISQLSAMKNLEEMFSADWQAEKEEECPNGEYLVETALENLRGMDRLMEANASTSSIMNLIRQKEEKEEAQKEPKIMRDSSSFPFTAYRIVVQNSEFDTSEVSSICGSSRSDPYEKHKSSNLDAPAGPSSQGLWELTGKNSRAKFEKPENANSPECRHPEGMMMLGPGPMFDSVISSHSSLASTSAQRSRIGTTTGNGQQQMAPGGGIMYDSAICTDFQSSAEDEDWRENWEQQEQCKEEEGRIIRPRAKSGILRKYGDIDEDRPLSKISEQSTPIKRVSTPSTGIRPPSLQGSEPSSLEWF